MKRLAHLPTSSMVLITLLALPLSGCITAMGRLQVANGPTIQEVTGTPVYASTAYDFYAMGEYPGMIPIFLLDLPFAVVVDTILFLPDLSAHAETNSRR